MLIMKNTLLYTMFVLALIIAGIGYYYYSPPAKNIFGRALVLMFVNDSAKHDGLISLWEKSDLSVELIDDCIGGQVEKRAACASQYIRTALSRTKNFNKSLLVLADQDAAQTLLTALTENNANQVDGLILLQAKVDEYIAENIAASKTLIISDVNDPAENVLAIRQLASKIRSNNKWVWSTMLAHAGGGLLAHPALPQMASYLINGKINAAYQIEFNAESSWQDPIVDNNQFFQQPELIETRPIDKDIKRILKAFYAYDLNLLKLWPLKQYKAFNLVKYRDFLPENERGRFTVFSNRKGHKFYLDLQRYEKYKPEFVVAIDDEENLYRMTSFYRTKRYYSWEPGGPSDEMLYSQSLGAFIHFQNPPPVRMELPYLQYSSILFESIKFTDHNPYAEINGLSEAAFEVLTLNCIPCHQVNGVGGSAHHLDYLAVKPQPGFAQPLLSYSEDVLENFFFNQTATAQLIGVNPNYVEAKTGKELMTWLLAK